MIGPPSQNAAYLKLMMKVKQKKHQFGSHSRWFPDTISESFSQGREGLACYNLFLHQSVVEKLVQASSQGTEFITFSCDIFSMYKSKLHSKLITLPLSTVPFPRTYSPMILQSVVLAAILSIYGATLTMDAHSGPLFPAEFMVKIPLCIAWEAPIAMESVVKSTAPPRLNEIEMMSTHQQ